MLVTHSFYCADCDTDHSFVVRKVSPLPKGTHYSRQKLLHRITISTAGAAMSKLCVKLAKAIDEALEDCPTDSATSIWNHIRDIDILV